MQITSDVTSLVFKTKEEFQKRMTTELTADIIKDAVIKAVPLKDGEQEKINDANFKNRLKDLLTPMAGQFVEDFADVKQFDTGNLFTSLVGSVTDSVALEADYRQQRLLNNIQLGRIENDTIAINTAVESAFANTKSFESKDITNRFFQDTKFVFSTEAVDEVVEKIKEDVKTAIEETAGKNELVEGTTKEIIDYKNEIAPPDDQYVDPENPDDVANSASADPNATPTEDPTADAGDDALAGEGDATGEDEQIYNEPAQEEPQADPNATPEDPTAANPTDPGAEGDPTADPNADMGGDDAGLPDDGDASADEGLGDDAGGEGDIPDEPPANDGGEPAPDVNVDNGNTSPTGNSGGITININGADLASAKESLNLFTPQRLAETRVPLNVKEFQSMSLPNVADLASECVNAFSATGSVSEEFKIRFDGLKFGIDRAKNTMSEESYGAIKNKFDEYTKIATEAFSKESYLEGRLDDLGINKDGLTVSNENTLCVARNIIERFLTKKRFVNVDPLPYNSKENVFANAFDILQLRQAIDRKGDKVDQAIVDDYLARESVFTHNMIKYDDPEVKKMATAVVDLSLMNFQKAMSANFITDYRIKSWELNVGENANKDTNAEVVKRVKSNFEKLWCRELNEDEMKIIKATSNQEDVTEICPTPYEKFMVKMSKEALESKEGFDPSNRTLSLTQDEKKSIEWRSRLMTTVFKTAESFGILGNKDYEGFDKFCNMVQI